MIAKVETVFKSPKPNPNGIQAAKDGLWILDQGTNEVFKVRYNNGSIIVALKTDSDRGSGITEGGGAIWIASTYNRQLLKVNPKSGETIASFPTPGAQKTGAHGMEWVDGKIWVAVPPSATIYQLDPQNNLKVIHSIPAPGNRPHGLAWDNGYLWCVETNHRAIYKLDPKDGRQVDKIEILTSYPEPHGMTRFDEVFWYCDATTEAVCRIIM